MQRTIVTCGIIAGAFIVLVVVGIVLGGVYMSRPLPPIVIPPPPPLPVDNGFDLCVQAASLVKDGNKLDKIDPTKQPREAEALVKLNRPALDLVRKALPKDYMTPRVKKWDEDFPYMHGFRNIARLFVLQGQLKASRADVRGAVESFLDARRFGALIPNGGWSNHWLIGLMADKRGYQGLESICSKLDAPQCRYVLDELRKADARQPTFVQMLEWQGVGNLIMLQSLQDTLARTRGTYVRGPLIDRLLVGLGRSSVEDYEDYMRKYKAEAAKPFHLRRSLPEPKGMLTELMVPMTGILTLSSEISTQGQILKLMLALRHYRLEHGAYPQSLTGLKSYGIGTVDEFSGKPLVYRRTADGYLLYSVGPDGKDDGGKPLNEGQGDIVAGNLFGPNADSRDSKP